MRDSSGLPAPAIEVRRSSRRTLAIQVVSSDRVVIRAPHRMSTSAIDGFVSARSAWIEQALLRLRERELLSGPPPSPAETERMRADARRDLELRVARWTSAVGAEPQRIQIRNQRTRWGSCSSSGTVSFNLQLMRVPEWVRDYVVVHELAHLIHPNHGPQFWALVHAAFPRHREARAFLREVVLHP